jgi:hypothetical protein
MAGWLTHSGGDCWGFSSSAVGLGDTDEPCREISLAAAAAGLESLIGPDCCRPPLFLFLFPHVSLHSP